MERLFVYIFIGLLLLVGAFFFVVKKIFIDALDQESNFGYSPESMNQDEDGNVEINPAPREHVAYLEQQSNIIITAIKKAPKTIMTTIFIQLFLMLFTGYLSVQNIERLAMAGSALTQGDYGMAVSALWPIGKEAGVEQWNVVRGTDPYLKEKDLDNFVYVGKLNGKKLAIMERLYSTQDHDDTLKKTDESYDTVILGLSASRAKDICEDKYNSVLLSIVEWKFTRGHFIAARNVEEFPEIPEWTRNVSQSDSDDYMVIEKNSNIKKWAKKEDVDREEDGLYIDEDELPSAGFRCSITWK